VNALQGGVNLPTPFPFHNADTGIASTITVKALSLLILMDVGVDSQRHISKQEHFLAAHSWTKFVLLCTLELLAKGISVGLGFVGWRAHLDRNGIVL
jgi:hypothetical protein